MKPLAGYRWEGSWEPIMLTNKTDNTGYSPFLSISHFASLIFFGVPEGLCMACHGQL